MTFQNLRRGPASRKLNIGTSAGAIQHVGLHPHLEDALAVFNVDLKREAEASECKHTAVMQATFFETVVPGEDTERSADDPIVEVVGRVVDLDSAAPEVLPELIIRAGFVDHVKYPT